MKKEILRVLAEAEEGFVSGQVLCEQLGVTRQAIWKNMNQLRDNGFQIESVPNRGYRLVTVTEKLYAPEIERRLPEKGLCKKVICLESTDSTNVQAKNLAEKGEPEGTLILAESQEYGRGRRGRRWESASGSGVWMSLLLRPTLKPYQIAGITLLTALAVVKTIRQVCGVLAQIKWPNDIVLGQKKLAGILTEMSSEQDFIHYAVVGVGINVNQKSFPDEIGKIATSLLLATGESVNRVELITGFIEVFEEYYERFLRDGHLGAFVEDYNAVLANRDREVRIYHGTIEEARPEHIEEGVARGIDRTGALLVDTDLGQKAIVSGEVSVRGRDGYV